MWSKIGVSEVPHVSTQVDDCLNEWGQIVTNWERSRRYERLLTHV